MDDFIIPLLKDYFKSDDFILSPITGGGSSRRFYRGVSNSESVIVSVTDDREEFDYYTLFAADFHKRGVDIPVFHRIYPENLTVIMEDAGKNSLYDIASDSKNSFYLESIYKKVLEKLVLFQKMNFSKEHKINSRPFGIETLKWETSYFSEHFLKTLLGRGDLVTDKITREFEVLAQETAKQPFVNMHRDFQSQNIYINSGRIIFIDFQGSRRGSLFYDAASLILDPYVSLDKGLISILIDFYIKISSESSLHTYSLTDARKAFVFAALQRIMQALGAYGNLGINKGKKNFLAFVPSAFETLLFLLEASNLPELKKVCLQLEFYPGLTHEKFSDETAPDAQI